MASFYGGKQGITYHIVERYDSIADMVDNFSKGGAYTAVNYGQYVIIDTILNQHKKNSQQNGLLYRRGFQYDAQINTAPNINELKNENQQIEILVQNSTEVVTVDVAKYSQNLKKYYNYNLTMTQQQYETCYDDETGTININLLPRFDQLQVIETFNQELWQQDIHNFFVNPGAGAIYIGQIVGPQGTNTQINVANWGTNSGIQSTAEVSVAGIVQQQGSNATFNDKALVKAVNILDENDNIESSNLQFKIPYPVIRMSASTVDFSTSTPTTIWHNYYNDDGTLTSASWVPQRDGVIHKAETQTPHPYYLDYQIAIPKGDKGDPGITQMGLEGDNIYVVYSNDNLNTDTDIHPSTDPSSTIRGKRIGTTGSAYHIQGIYTIDQLSRLSEGFLGNAKGWAAVVKEGENAKLYAYDYAAKGEGAGSSAYWKEVQDLGKIGLANAYITVIYENEQIPDSLNGGGIAFRIVGTAPVNDSQEEEQNG